MIRARNLPGVFLIVVAVASLTSGCRTKQPNLKPAVTGPEERLATLASGCQTLQVNARNSAGSVISIPSDGVACEHGYYQSSTPSTSNVQFVTVEQSSVYGPDCNITFNANNQIYVIRAQQNYCFFSAGDVTASVVSGNAVITGTQSGSASGTPGQVWVTLN